MDEFEVDTPVGIENKEKKAFRGPHILSVGITALVFIAFTVVFLFFPRSEYSELEKRDLAGFPDMALLGEDPAAFTAAVSRWFSDSEPYRDEFMTLSMYLRDAFKFNPANGEDAVSFIPSETVSLADDTESDDIKSYDSSEATGSGNPLSEANAKIAAAGIIIVGSGEDVRALMAYGGGPTSGTPFAQLCNDYAEAFPGVNVYAMPIPTATEFYLPEKAAGNSRPQKPTLDHIAASLSPTVRMVDAYSQLAAHTYEPIYLRTDHHWAPLGAFYAAKALAQSAGVPFRDLESYDEHVIHRHVGSMYGYSKNIAVKNAPEDFVYYIPRGVSAKTTYISYILDENYKITGQRGPYEGKFFHHFKDGSGAAYLTFMGGDTNTARIKTGSPGSRKLLIIKDSFGNPLPSFLFYSFNEIHVVDFRYFTQNMKEYVKTYGITDIVMAFNVFNVCSSGSMGRVRRFLTQAPGIHIENPDKETSDEVPESDSEESDSPSSDNTGQPDKITSEPDTISIAPVPLDPD